MAEVEAAWGIGGGKRLRPSGGNGVFYTFQVADGELRCGPDVQHQPFLRLAGGAVRQGPRRQPLVGGQQAQGRRGAIIRDRLPREGGVIVVG